MDLEKGADLIDGPETAGFGETRLSGKDFSGILGIGIVVRKSERKKILLQDDEHVNIDLDRVD